MYVTLFAYVKHMLRHVNNCLASNKLVVIQPLLYVTLSVPSSVYNSLLWSGLECIFNVTVQLVLCEHFPYICNYVFTLFDVRSTYLHTVH
jgi:hypothetical protein